MWLAPSDLVLRKDLLKDFYPREIREVFPGLLEALQYYPNFNYTEETRLTVVGFVFPPSRKTITIKTSRWKFRRGLKDMEKGLKGQWCLQTGKFDLEEFLKSFTWPEIPIPDWGHLLSHLILGFLLRTALPDYDPEYSFQPDAYRLSEFVWISPDNPGHLYIIYDKALRYEVLAPALWLAQVHLINLCYGIKPKKKLSVILWEARIRDEEQRELYHIL